MRIFTIISTCTLLALNASTFAASMNIPMFLTSDGKTSIGTVKATDTAQGLVLTPHLDGLAPGYHGFHVHQNPSCDDQGMAAGGHLDPAKTNQHLGPYRAGHLGDMPVLRVNADGTANSPIVIPRLTVGEIQGHSLIIHAGGDNYSDNPKLGGGGARIACGII